MPEVNAVIYFAPSACAAIKALDDTRHLTQVVPIGRYQALRNRVMALSIVYLNKFVFDCLLLLIYSFLFIGWLLPFKFFHIDLLS